MKHLVPKTIVIVAIIVVIPVLTSHFVTIASTNKQKSTIELTENTRHLGWKNKTLLEYIVAENTQLYDVEGNKIKTISKGTHVFISENAPAGESNPDLISVLLIPDKDWNVIMADQKRGTNAFIPKESLKPYHMNK